MGIGRSLRPLSGKKIPRSQLRGQVLKHNVKKYGKKTAILIGKGLITGIKFSAKGIKAGYKHYKKSQRKRR